MPAPSIPKISLQFVKKIVVQFCPWERNVRSTRVFLSHVGSLDARKSNPDCKVQTIIKNDASPPHIDIDFLDGKKLVFKPTNLTSTEMIHMFKKWHGERKQVEKGKEDGAKPAAAAAAGGR